MACASNPMFWAASSTYSGRYSFHPFGIDFVPDGSSEVWVLVGAVKDLPGGPKTGTDFEACGVWRHAVVRGRLSSHGEYGHVGGCSRALSVVKILEVSPTTSESR